AVGAGDHRDPSTLVGDVRSPPAHCCTSHGPEPYRNQLIPVWFGAGALVDPAAESQARGLAGRESSCCSFFTFDFAPVGERAGHGLAAREKRTLAHSR